MVSGCRKQWENKEFECFGCHSASRTPCTFEAEVSKLVMRLVRLHGQHESDTDGAVHWKSMRPKLRKAFQKARGQKIEDSD